MNRRLPRGVVATSKRKGREKTYLFGVSIYSLYGRPRVMDQPNRYGMGRISDPLELIFEK